MALPTRVTAVERGRLHTPQDGASFPGIVLIHDVWGPSPHSEDLAADLAGEGFAVLEIDLYRNLGEVEIETPGPFIRSLCDPDILADLDASAAWLGEQPSCVGRKLGVTGVCMGGTYTLLAASKIDRFSAAAPFYGVLSYENGLLEEPGGRDRSRKPESPIEAAAALRMPLLASFGDQDEFVPLGDIAALKEGLAKSGHPHEVDVYAGAGHAFLNRTREAAYKPEASAQAWARVMPFLHGHLD